MTIKAIETRYKGYRFRSRLEARWAVFFDALGLEWEYEPEGFHLSDGRNYLPDFKITSRDNFVYWYEIKPKNGADDGKMGQFEKDCMNDDFEYTGQGKNFQVLAGDPVEALSPRPWAHVCPRCGSVSASYIDCGSGEYYGCYPCDMATPCGGDHPEEWGLGVYVRPHKGLVLIDDDYYRRGWKGFVMNAAQKARAARFEHGECG